MRLNDLYEEKRVDILSKILNPDLIKLRKCFVTAGKDIKIVGGAVRDILLNKEPSDIDLCTNSSPKEQIAIYKNNNYHYIETGLQHGTITVIINKEPYEITSCRTESNFDGRHAKVNYTQDWIADLSCRDLTVNSMALSFDGELLDPYGGEQDLKNGVVKFVGNPLDRMNEDYLRCLRFFRFFGRFGGMSFDPSTEDAIKQCVKGLKKISGERIWMEMSKIIVGRNNNIVLSKMYELGVAQIIGLPQYGADRALLINQFNRKIKTPITVLAFLIDNIQDAQKLNDRWKFSNPAFKLLYYLVGKKNTDFNLEIAQDMAVDGIELSWLHELAILKNDQNVANQIINWNVPYLPISGRNLENIGIKPGPEMGKLLKQLKTVWKESRFKLSKEELLKLVQQQQ